LAELDAPCARHRNACNLGLDGFPQPLLNTFHLFQVPWAEEIDKPSRITFVGKRRADKTGKFADLGFHFGSTFGIIFQNVASPFLQRKDRVHKDRNGASFRGPKKDT